MYVVFFLDPESAHKNYGTQFQFKFLMKHLCKGHGSKPSYVNDDNVFWPIELEGNVRARKGFTETLIEENNCYLPGESGGWTHLKLEAASAARLLSPSDTVT